MPGGFDSDAAEDENLGEDDTPPAFPALNSAQRMSSPSTDIPKILTDEASMPPPPLPSLAVRQPGVSSSLSVPQSSASLALPPSTTKKPLKPPKNRKVALAPGFGALDWANLKQSGTDLRVSSIDFLF